MTRYAAMEGDEYVQKAKGISMFDQIGQRLYTGKIPANAMWAGVF